MKPYYEQDGITIYHGDALAVLAELESASVDVLLADPPYSSGGMFRGDRQAPPSQKYGGFVETNGVPKGWGASKTYPEFSGDSRDQRSFGYWSAMWLGEALRITREGGLAFVFTDWRQLPMTTDALQAGGWTWRGIVNWHKGHARPIKGRFRANVEYAVWGSAGPLAPHADVYPSSLVEATPPSSREHPTQKPTDVCTHLLMIAPAEATVLDPFMGSGTTLVAAQMTGRRAVGIETQERYCEIAANRLQREALVAA